MGDQTKQDKQGRHEVKLPTVVHHQITDHKGELVSDWLVAEWGFISAYNCHLRPDDRLHGLIMIDTSVRNDYDDSDTPTELWCRDHMVEVRKGLFEIDYE